MVTFLKEFISEVPFEDSPQEIDFTKERLGYVHRFAGQQIGHSEHNLDIGWYDGFGCEYMKEYAAKTTVIDVDGRMFIRALKNPIVQQLLEDNRLNIAQMDATNISFAPNMFTSATCIEVFGAGFRGEHEDVASVFQGIHRVLQPGGKLVFTVKSKISQTTLDLLSRYLAFNDTFQPAKTVEKGYPLYRQEVEDIVNPLFGSVDWYGHFYFEKQNGNLLIPIPVDNESMGNLLQKRFIPRVIDEENEIALYRIGVCQKPY